MAFTLPNGEPIVPDFLPTKPVRVVVNPCLQRFQDQAGPGRAPRGTLVTREKSRKRPVGPTVSHLRGIHELRLA